MPAPSPPIGKALESVLRDLGQRLRAQRKRLGVSLTATAEAAGMSRVTLHRIERGEASVAMGAWLAAISALGLSVELLDPRARQGSIKIPGKIRIAEYPQLKRLAWQLKGTTQLEPREALDLYERNWRHLDVGALGRRERELLESLQKTFGSEHPLV
jgi:transcriptional regulator with XRE-family HTH domain